MSPESQLQNYLGSFKNADSIHLVGPMNIDFDVSQVSGPILFVDGGSKHKKDSGITVGDGDSSHSPCDVPLSQEKDFSDLEFCLKSIKGKFQNVFLWGFLGGRNDHELANILCCLNSLNDMDSTSIVMDQSHYFYSQGHWNFNVSGTFSMFTAVKNKISLNGSCKYSLNDEYLKELSSHGLSNEGTGEINLSCSASLLLILT